MADLYSQLLEATIQQLQDLKMRGARFVAVSSDTLAALSSSPRQARVSERPQPALAPAATRDANLFQRGGPTEARAAAPFAPLPASADASVLGSESTLSLAAKTAAFAELRTRVLGCTKCPHLIAARKNVVFGVGSIEARLMFVGEAPGADEDEQGEPFVGKAGQLLTKIIQTMGLSRDTVYIANILKCRPDTPGQLAGNRKPTPEEMQMCRGFLEEQIDIIRPEVLVALGATAVEGLLGKTVGITRLRGHWQSYRGIPLMPTYHPAYLLRNQALSEKRRVWEDMLAVMEKLGLSISDKQRRYFLPSA